MLLLSSADFISKLTFSKILSRILSDCQTIWTQIRTDKMSVLIWVQTICISYQQTTKVSTGKERVKEVLVYTFDSVFSFSSSASSSSIPRSRSSSNAMISCKLRIVGSADVTWTLSVFPSVFAAISNVIPSGMPGATVKRSATWRPVQFYNKPK